MSDTMLVKKDNSFPKGYRCTCGEFNEFPAYVYAHWDILLNHTCNCGLEYQIRSGKADCAVKEVPLEVKDGM